MKISKGNNSVKYVGRVTVLVLCKSSTSLGEWEHNNKSKILIRTLHLSVFTPYNCTHISLDITTGVDLG